MCLMDETVSPSPPHWAQGAAHSRGLLGGLKVPERVLNVEPEKLDPSRGKENVLTCSSIFRYVIYPRGLLWREWN